MRFTLQPKTQNPPLAPIGGEGSGVRGNTTPKTRHRSSPTKPHTAAVHINRQLCELCVLCGLKNTTHTRLSRAELGLKPELRGGPQQGVAPLTPVPSPLPGARGAGALHRSKIQIARLRFIRENPCSSVAKNTPHPWRKTPRNPRPKQPPTAQSGTTPDPRAASPR